MLRGLLVTVESTESEKLKTEIQQDLLDRAGYGKITKAVHVHGAVDHTTSRRELINLIKTKAKQAGVTVEASKDDSNDSDDVIDVTPVPKTGDASAYSDAKQVRGKDKKSSSDNSDK